MKNASEKEKAKLKAAFESATSCEEMFKAVTKMARSGLFDENELGLEYYKLSNKFLQEGHDPLQFVSMMSSGGNTRGKEAELKQAFYAATSADEMIQALTKMESHIKEENLGMECFTLTQKLHEESNDMEKIIFYGNKALKFFVGHNNTTGAHRSVLMMATTLLMLGSACRKLGRFDESLSYLNQCETKSSELLKETSYPAELVLGKLHEVHSELAQVKYVLGKGDEAVFHMKKMLELQEKRGPEGSVEIGKGYNVLADTYVGVGNFKEALLCVLKALEVYSAKRVGIDSGNLARLRKNLGVIYCAMKENGKALERIGSSVSGLKLVEEMEAANMLLMLSKFEEGVGAMKAVISRAISQGADFTRATASVALARALCKQEKFGDAKKYLKLAQRIVEKQQIHPLVLAVALEDLSKMYKEMEEIETYGDTRSYNQAILKVLEGLKGLGFKADGAIGLVKEMKMKERASGGDSSEGNSSGV